MPVSLHRSSSLSTLSNAKANLQISVGMGRNGLASLGQSIGAEFDFSTLFFSSTNSIMGNEKLYMQNLNSRLASYMEKVFSLEQANLKLEQKIKEFYESRSAICRTDLSKYHIIMEDLQKQIICKVVEKQQVFMMLENESLTASDFKMKFEKERNIRLTVETDSTCLCALLGETDMATKSLQIQKVELEEELAFLKKSHEENMHIIRYQQSDTVNVQVDCAPAVNLNKELEDMREQYETLILNNHKQIEQWFQSKVKTLNTVVFERHTEITSSQKALSQLKKTYQTMEIEIKGIQTQIQTLLTDLVQVRAHYSEQLSQLQVLIDRLQTELQQITGNMKQQALEYELLLNIKMRLEQEIEEYRRLLGGELQTKTIVEEMVHKEKEKHLHQKRVKVITEELVDGVVVTTSIKESVQDLKD